jgi:hypothetical protein
VTATIHYVMGRVQGAYERDVYTLSLEMPGLVVASAPAAVMGTLVVPTISVAPAATSAIAICHCSTTNVIMLLH